MSIGLPTSKHSAAPDDPNEDHDHGDHEEDVNESSYRVRGYQSEHPQHDEDDGDYPQHALLLPGLTEGPRVRRIALRSWAASSVWDYFR